MDKLTKQQVEHIANLAHIELTSAEIELFQEQLTNVIEYNMYLLNEVDTTNIMPTAQTTGLQNVWRDDEIQQSLDSTLALSQAPDKADGQFRVKRVLGDS